MTHGLARQGTVAAGVAAVRTRIAAACARAGRDPADVTLVAVTKTWPAEVAAEAARAGASDLGENRVQEALAKVAAWPGGVSPPRWHLVGHLQTNKVRAAVGRFAILHAVDSERLLLAIERAASEAGIRQKVMIEVNVAAEPTKFGVAPRELRPLLAAAAALPAVQVSGLMTVAPPVPEPERARPVFRELRELARANGLPCLSMGMTGDFEVAIEEGATHVRVGRAIFGERQP